MKVEEFVSSRVWKREGRNTVGFPGVSLFRKRRAEGERGDEFASSKVCEREGRKTVGFPGVPLSRKRRAEEE